MTNQDSRIYPFGFSGLSTRPDVNRLMQRWPKLVIGQYVNDEDIEKELGISRSGTTERRYDTIIKAWIRKLQNDHSIILKREKSAKRLKVLDANEVADNALDGISRSRRMIRRRRMECATVRPSNDQERQRLLHTSQLALMQENALKDARKKMLKIPEPQQKPKLVAKK